MTEPTSKPAQPYVGWRDRLEQSFYTREAAAEQARTSNAKRATTLLKAVPTLEKAAYAMPLVTQDGKTITLRQALDITSYITVPFSAGGNEAQPPTLIAELDASVQQIQELISETAKAVALKKPHLIGGLHQQMCETCSQFAAQLQLTQQVQDGAAEQVTYPYKIYDIATFDAAQSLETKAYDIVAAVQLHSKRLNERAAAVKESRKFTILTVR